MSSPAEDIAKIIRQKHGNRSGHLRVWNCLTAKFDLQTAEMVSIGMIQSACPDLSREIILRSMQYFCGGGLRIFEFVVAVDVDSDILEISSEDIIKFTHQRSTIGLINPETGEFFEKDLPVISFFRPTDYFRTKFQSKARVGREHDSGL